MIRRIPIRSLAKLAGAWASPEVDRPVFWRTLIGRDSWALLLITKGEPTDPPARPERGPNMRLSSEWARRTGAGALAGEFDMEALFSGAAGGSPASTVAGEKPVRLHG